MENGRSIHFTNFPRLKKYFGKCYIHIKLISLSGISFLKLYMYFFLKLRASFGPFLFPLFCTNLVNLCACHRRLRRVFRNFYFLSFCHPPVKKPVKKCGCSWLLR